MNYTTEKALIELAQEFDNKYSLEEIDYFIGKLKKRRLDEMHKASPYGTYALLGNTCPYCGK
jgi:hypothetical protein